MESQISGIVPEFDEREAAVYVHLSWEQYKALDSSERAAAIAHYRMSQLVKAHIDHALNDAQAKQQQKADRAKNASPHARRRR